MQESERKQESTDLPPSINPTANGENSGWFRNLFRRKIASGRSLSSEGIRLLVLGLVGGLVIAVLFEDGMKRLVFGEERDPFILALMTEGARDFTIPNELRNGMIERGNTVSAEGGREIEIRQRSAPKGKTAASLQNECLQHEECLAIVGGSNSTETNIILETLIAYDDGPRPSLIMPIATSDSLTVNAGSAGYSRLLRLVPSNLNQARRIRSFVSRRGVDRNVLLIKDNQNSVYATDLTNTLIQEFRDVGIDADPRDFKDGGTVAGLEPASLARSDYIIFVGDATTGMRFVEDMKRNKINKPVIFTDGNTVAEVVREANGLLGPAYFLTPVRELTNLREPGYTAIGRDTYEIVRHIAGLADSLDRDGFAGVIESRVNDITLNPGAAGSYRFGTDGENRSMEFHIFTMSDDKVRFVRF